MQNGEFKFLQKQTYDKNVLKLDSVRQAIDGEGFNYNLTLKAVKIRKIINFAGLFPGADVLDIGCRNGRLLNKLKIQFQTNNYGIDISSNQINESVHANPFNNYYFVADAEFLPFAENSFDFVFCFDVLEHLPDYRQCIKEIAFVLKKNGRAIFCAVSKNQKYTLAGFLRRIKKGPYGPGRMGIHQPEYFLDPDGAINWCKMNGFEIEKTVYFYPFFTWAFDEFLLKALERINKRFFAKNGADNLANSTGNTQARAARFSSGALFFVKAWSLIISGISPILEFIDLPWTKRGFGSGFFLQVKKID